MNVAAEEADYGGMTVGYMFCPFGEATLRLVLERIGPVERELRIAFVNPAAGHRDVFADATWLRLDDEWHGAGESGHSVLFFACSDGGRGIAGRSSRAREVALTWSPR